MKTAVSIPDDVFEAAERLAKRLNKARSALYAEAIALYVARHDPEAVTDAMNAACDAIGQEADDFTKAAARRALERAEW